MRECLLQERFGGVKLTSMTTQSKGASMKTKLMDNDNKEEEKDDDNATFSC